MPLKVKFLPSTQQNIIDDLTMVFFSYRNRLTLIAYLICRLFFMVLQGKRIELEKEENLHCLVSKKGSDYRTK
jgi:hypothetical protein